jgi:hypothetical protein
VGQQEASGETEAAKTATGAVNSQWPGRRSSGPPHLHLRRHHGWQIELFFKELKETFGFDQYRFRQFAKVAGWVQACLAAFCYREWYRARQLARRDLPDKERVWWAWQRSHGIRLAVLQEAEEQELAQLYRQTGTPSGRKQLRRCLRAALPLEYRKPREKRRESAA